MRQPGRCSAAGRPSLSGHPAAAATAGDRAGCPPCRRCGAASRHRPAPGQPAPQSELLRTGPLCPGARPSAPPSCEFDAGQSDRTEAKSGEARSASRTVSRADRTVRNTTGLDVGRDALTLRARSARRSQGRTSLGRGRDQTGGHQRPVHRQAAVRARRYLGHLLEWSIDVDTSTAHDGRIRPVEVSLQGGGPHRLRELPVTISEVSGHPPAALQRFRRDPERGGGDRLSRPP